MKPHYALWLIIFVLIATISFLGISSCSKQPNAATANDHVAIRFHACEGKVSSTSTKCARVEVPENYRQPEGSKLSIFLKVLPARQKKTVQEPVFILAGGPGQAATETVTVMGALLNQLRRHHDVILIDQRGTGRSNALDCELDNTLQLADLFRTDIDPDALKRCLNSYEVNPRNFTTDAFIDDLDRVRRSLGYPSISLYGISYGTRAALAYLAKYSDHVAGVVLDGSAPPTIKIPLYFGADGQAALEQLFEDCAHNKTCSNRFPNLDQRFFDLLDRLAREPAHVKLSHPRSGEREAVTIHRDAIASIVRGALYSTTTSALIPLAIDNAEDDDYQLFAALADIATLTADSISFGLFLSVICSEDVQWINDKEQNLATKNTFLGKRLVQSLDKACAQWPKSPVSSPVNPNIQDHAPVLLLSGGLDPATPPKWGGTIAAGLSNHRHVVFPNIGHGTWSTHCGLTLIRNFLKHKDLNMLDDNCAATITRPAFFLNPLGIYD